MDILLVKESGHFVVVKGDLSNTYAINDPEWNTPVLSSFGNSYMQVDRYIPSNTNLSYIVIVVNPNIELLVTDPLGRKTGRQTVDGQANEYSEIPEATYSLQDPISNDAENLGTGVNEFLLPEPMDGSYTITLSSKEDENYTLNISSYENDGNNTLNTLEGVASPNNEDRIILNYLQTETPESNRMVNLQSTLGDIQQLQTLNLITDDKIAKKLIKLLERIQKHDSKDKSEQILKTLDQFENLLNKEKGVTITEQAYEILLYDINYLKNNLN